LPSVVAGVTVGALVCSSFHLYSNVAVSNIDQYILGGLRIQNRSTYGTELALLASVILAGSSIPRAIKSGKPLPIGLSVLATFGLWTFGNAFLNRQRTV
jgi:uncharacterized membrane protein (UPF0136 family)